MADLFHRVSIRKYQDRPVEREKIVEILRAAMAAPVTYKIIEGAAGTYTINAEAASVCIVGSLRVIRRQRRR